MVYGIYAASNGHVTLPMTS